MKKTATFYYIVWTRNEGKTVRAGKVVCRFDDPNGVTNKALQECKKAARYYVADTGEEVGYCIGGGSTDIGKRAKSFMSDTDIALYGRIKKNVPEIVKQMTLEGMERYGMSLYDSFKNAAATWTDKHSKLYKAWYMDDFREYIPSAYISKYLDFDKYPLAY